MYYLRPASRSVGLAAIWKTSDRERRLMRVTHLRASMLALGTLGTILIGSEGVSLAETADVAQVVVQPADVPSLTSGIGQAPTLNLVQFAQALDPTDAGAQATDRKVLKRARFEVGSVVVYTSRDDGNLRSWAIRAQPGHASQIVSWTVRGAHSKGVRIQTLALARPKGGTLVIAQQKGQVIGYLAVIHTRVIVACVQIVRLSPAPSLRETLRLATVMWRHATATSAPSALHSAG